MRPGWQFAETESSLLRGGNWPLLGIVGLLALIFAVVLVLALVRRRNEPSRNEAQREIYGNVDGQIRSMLLQAGGALTQDKIRENLDIPVADIGRELEAMEQRGEIRREWMPLDYTYRVFLGGSAADRPPAQPDAPPVDPKGLGEAI